MARRAILILSLFALAFGAASCHLPCREPFWKKPQSMALF
jgi:hypothetical protein